MPVRPRYVERTSSPKVLASFMASMMSWSTPIETFTVCDPFAPWSRRTSTSWSSVGVSTTFASSSRLRDFGGTWCWNHYPGVQCDIESYIYLPLLEETGYIPDQRFAGGDISVARLLTHAEQNGYRQIEASERSQQAWVRTIREANESRRTYLMHCTPGYFNVLWDVARGFFDETYGPGEIEF